MGKDYYKIIQLPPNASSEHIRKSYYKLALQHHPDKNKNPGSEDKFKEIQEAYKVLIDNEKRRIYDFILQEEERKTQEKQKQATNASTT